MDIAFEVIKLKKRKKTTDLVISFSGGLNPALASNAGEYELVVAGKHKSFTAKNAKKLSFSSAVYSAANSTVALTPSKKNLPKKLMELVVNGEPVSGLEDTSGRLIDGNNDGQPGGNATAVIRGKSVTITSAIARSTMVDLLLEQGHLSAPRRKSH